MNREMMSQKKFNTLMWLVTVVAILIAIVFCTKKQGMHYDENYSYYSTNVTNGLRPTNGEWMSADTIRNEFVVISGEGLNLSGVKLSQSYDVHPPLYYFVLRIVCWLTKDTFSMWQGLFINLVFYLVCLVVLKKIANLVGKNNQYITLFTMLIFTLSPGFLSTVTFIRMYMMLTAICFSVLYIALRAVDTKTYDFKTCYVPTFLLTLAGFLTHYFFAVFMFWIAAYMCIYLFMSKDTRKKAFVYGTSVILGMGGAVLYYPACLSHIFRGYRGTEATEAFKDVSNTWDRFDFYIKMLNEFTFSGFFYVLALMVILIYVSGMYKKTKDDKNPGVYNKPVVGMLVFVTIMFFLTVCKTGMIPSNPQEALRYACPSYGLIILIMVMAVYRIKKWYIPVAVLTVAVLFQIAGLFQNKVFFVYPEKIANYEFARERSEKNIVYIYNPNNEWMIWNDSMELMNYKDIFFVDYMYEDSLNDECLKNSESTYVYACRSDQSLDLIQKLIDMDDNINEYEKVEERLYVDIYELK